MYIIIPYYYYYYLHIYSGLSSICSFIKIRSAELQTQLCTTVSVIRNYIPQIKLQRWWCAGSGLQWVHTYNILLYNNDKCTALFLQPGIACVLASYIIKIYIIMYVCLIILDDPLEHICL